MKTVSVRDWNELSDTLFSDTWDPRIKRFRSTFAYRGLNVSNYRLDNGLSRLGRPYPNLEKNLIKQFKKYAHEHVAKRFAESEWHWISIAQHHGLPTRLLDWTYSPYIALHFATSSVSEFNEDAAVWKVNYAQAHELLQNEHRKVLQEYGSSIFSVDALAGSIKNLEELDAKHASNYDIAVFFEPPTLDDRIVNQFAYFSALSDPYLSMDDWFLMPHVLGKIDAIKIIIPARIKWEIRDKLDQSNINERVLMPGLDGLCSWLKRHYTPVGP
ncbi:FRG domain-containing protein [Rhodopseudomonas palustris]|uniref:FRG domain-containing protein n=1 Tax=Rhodopseudomonas palustris TaxID=1076 RepID=UPI0021F38C93|nr:FRG domain-containing protein [Rhodopseudomonas palustris]UYO43424.1 FRG domain-containing protein [Rhodopseudomonas palustris]